MLTMAALSCTQREPERVQDHGRALTRHPWYRGAESFAGSRWLWLCARCDRHLGANRLRGELPRTEEWPREIDVHNDIPVLFRHVLDALSCFLVRFNQAFVPQHAGVVDQHVAPEEPVCHSMVRQQHRSMQA